MDHAARSAGAKKSCFAVPQDSGMRTNTYRERVFGRMLGRLAWHRLLEQFRKGDVLVLGLGHFSRSLQDRPPGTTNA